MEFSHFGGYRFAISNIRQWYNTQYVERLEDASITNIYGGKCQTYQDYYKVQFI